MQVVGGATLVSSLMNLDLIDEPQLMVNPLILGGGKEDVSPEEMQKRVEAMVAAKK
jgi:riboflavin biosynthesis pyrimidine reductase